MDKAAERRGQWVAEICTTDTVDRGGVSHRLPRLLGTVVKIHELGLTIIIPGHLLRNNQQCGNVIRLLKLRFSITTAIASQTFSLSSVIWKIPFLR
jgi:hypothetical protein